MTQARSDNMPRRRPRVLAVSSGGGHWVQLLRLQPAFEGCDVTYATVLKSSRIDLDDDNARFKVLPDATRWNKLKLFWLLLRIIMLVIRTRPDAIVTTGAAPGYLSLVVGRLLGKRTCWIDSIARYGVGNFYFWWFIAFDSYSSLNCLTPFYTFQVNQ